MWSLPAPVSLVLLVTLVPSISRAATYRVKPDGTGDYATIQEAIDHTVDGDTVLLADGVFTGEGNRKISYGGRGITVRSASGDAAACVIDCSGEVGWCAAFLFENGEDENARLENVTMTNGWEGVLVCWQSSPRVLGCVFEENRGSSAVHCIQSCTPLFQECTFRDNGYAGWSGGALHSRSGAEPSIIDCFFEGNVALVGGGVDCRGTGSPLISGCGFVGNSAEDGGAISISYGSPVLVEDCWFEENTAIGGGGVSIDDSPATFRNCRFSGNTATACGGGAICGGVDEVPLFASCVWEGNEAPKGGAVSFFWAGVPRMEECTFYGNTGTDGSSVFCKYRASPQFSNTIIAFGVTGPRVYCDQSQGACAPTLECCDVYGNEGGDWVDCIATKSAGNFSADPLFCDASSGDFALRSDSPCLPGNHPDAVDCGLIGAFGEGCSGPTATTSTSWGGIKSLFR